VTAKEFFFGDWGPFSTVVTSVLFLVCWLGEGGGFLVALVIVGIWLVIRGGFCPRAAYRTLPRKRNKDDWGEDLFERDNRLDYWDPSSPSYEVKHDDDW